MKFIASIGTEAANKILNPLSLIYQAQFHPDGSATFLFDGSVIQGECSMEVFELFLENESSILTIETMKEKNQEPVEAA